MSIRNQHLINKQNVRKFILDVSAETRTHSFTRVGSETYDAIEAKLRTWLLGEIQRHPSIGKTFIVELPDPDA